MDKQRLEQIIAGYGLTTPGKWVIHYQHSRSKPHIVSMDAEGLEWWIAQGITSGIQCHNDILFACHAHQDIPELISEVERLQDELDSLRAELVELFGEDYLAGMRQFKEMGEGV